MAYFFLLIALLDFFFFCIELVTNNFFKTVNTNLEHPVDTHLYQGDSKCNLIVFQKHLPETDKYGPVNENLFEKLCFKK